ncbi:hypothetical protein [Streptomyces flavidovirens]
MARAGGADCFAGVVVAAGQAHEHGAQGGVSHGALHKSALLLAARLWSAAVVQIRGLRLSVNDCEPEEQLLLEGGEEY